MELPFARWDNCRGGNFQGQAQGSKLCETSSGKVSGGQAGGAPEGGGRRLQGLGIGTWKNQPGALEGNGEG